MARVRPTYVFGVDFGQASDYTARAVLERIGTTGPATYAVRDLARYPLQTPYQAVADDLALRWESPEVARAERHLVVDATGVGRPVLEMLDRHGIDIEAVTITGGYDVTRARGMFGIEYRVPKRDLAMTLQLLLQSGRLKIAEALEHADTLRAELMAFRVKVTKTGHDTYEAWRERDHDDLVLATAVAAWWAEHELLDAPTVEGRRPKAKPLADYENF